MARTITAQHAATAEADAETLREPVVYPLTPEVGVFWLQLGTSRELVIDTSGPIFLDGAAQQYLRSILNAGLA